MANIIIENVPDEIIKIYGTKIKYSKSINFPKKRIKDQTINLQKIVNDSENISYGPFDNSKDFLESLYSNKI